MDTDIFFSEDSAQSSVILSPEDTAANINYQLSILHGMHGVLAAAANGRMDDVSHQQLYGFALGMEQISKSIVVQFFSLEHAFMKARKASAPTDAET
jgi:hypothetical protein